MVEWINRGYEINSKFYQVTSKLHLGSDSTPQNSENAFLSIVLPSLLQCMASRESVAVYIVLTSTLWRPKSKGIFRKGKNDALIPNFLFEVATMLESQRIRSLWAFPNMTLP